MSDSEKRYVKIDSQRFDHLQIRVLIEIARDLKSALEGAGIEGEKLRGLTEDLTFGIAAIIDGSRVMDLDGSPVCPVLTFATKEEGAELLGADGGSWMHEYAVGRVEALFEGP